MLASFLTFLTEASGLATDELAAMGAVGMLAGAFAAMTIVGIVWYVLQVIAYWKIFTKAGEPGWKSIIPFYNSYTQFKLTWDAKYYLVIFVLGIVSSIVSSLSDGKGGFATAILAVIVLVIIVIGVIADFKLAAAFGHGIGFALGLVFFDPIFKLILGFGSSRYIGPNGIPQQNR